MIVSLPMYTSSPANVQSFWSQLSRHLHGAGLGGLPTEVTWPTDLSGHWRNPELLLSQTCGYPLVTELHNDVRVVGAFRYAATGCDGVRCRSALVVRNSDRAMQLNEFRGRTVAFNGTASQSGYNSLRALVAPLAQSGVFFSNRIETGSHRRSLEMVRDGLADIASIDCVSLAGFVRHAPDIVNGIRVMSFSDPYPGLPLITSIKTSDSDLLALRSALSLTMQDKASYASRKALFINGFEPLEIDDYRVCRDMHTQAICLNYPSL